MEEQQDVAQCPPVSSAELIEAMQYIEREKSRLIEETARELTAKPRSAGQFAGMVGRRGLSELYPDDPDKVEIIHARVKALHRTIGAGWLHPSIYGAAAIIPLLPDGMFDRQRLFETARRLREQGDRS